METGHLTRWPFSIGDVKIERILGDTPGCPIDGWRTVPVPADQSFVESWQRTRACRREIPFVTLPTLVEAPAQQSLLVIAAHPDDIESWCAGTLAESIDRASTVRLLLVTSGDKGSSDPNLNPADVADMREREASEAARRLGLTEVRFLRYPDGDVENTTALRGTLVEWIRRWTPDIVLTHDPEHPLPPYIAHRDHRVTGRATLDAVYPLARDPLAYREQLANGLTAHEVREVWLFASAIASEYVDISNGFERKIAARLAHESQTGDPVTLASSWRERFEKLGHSAGLSLAEAFTIVRLD